MLEFEIRVQFRKPVICYDLSSRSYPSSLNMKGIIWKVVWVGASMGLEEEDEWLRGSERKSLTCDACDGH